MSAYRRRLTCLWGRWIFEIAKFPNKIADLTLHTMASHVQRSCIDGRQVSRRLAFISVSRRNDEKEIARNSRGWRADNLHSYPGFRPDAGRTESRHGHSLGLDHRVARVFHEPRLRAG